MKFGIGYDCHQLVLSNQTQPMILAGCKIESDWSIVAVSDGDIVWHAVSDAILGAIAAGDIGEHFPDTEEKNKGISSQIILQHSINLAKDAGYEINNLDLVVVLQSTKLSPYKQAMRSNTAKVLQTSIANVNVKASTTEKLGFVGEDKGIEVHAVVSLKKLNER